MEKFCRRYRGGGDIGGKWKRIGYRNQRILWEGEGDLEDKVEEEWEMGEDGRGRGKGATGRRE